MYNINMLNELKEKCENSKRYKSLTDKELAKYKKEIKVAERYYKAGRDLLKELEEKKDKIQTQYVIPYLLELTDKITDEPFEYIQVKSGSSGGIDVDMDFQPEGRKKIFDYLKNKYGEDRVFYVGTYSELGPKSAAKDILRTYDIDFNKSNNFTKSLEKQETWEENIERIKSTDKKNYRFYAEHKEILDKTEYLIGKVRQSGKHAGGIVILDKPVYNYIPVERIKDELATAFVENGSNTVLDELGIIKFDVLGISILNVMDEAINMITEELYLIEDDDGIMKIVPESYIDKQIKEL